MRSALRAATLLLAIPIVWHAAVSSAEPYAVGGRLAPLSLPDQHGESHAVGEDVAVILFSRDMDGGSVVREVLADGGAALLESQRAVYVADVSRMPGLVRRLIAKPRMRRRPYPVLLDEQGEATARLPSREGHATVLFLDALRIERIEYPSSPDALKVLIEPPAAP